MRVLALSGSLRAASVNSALPRAPELLFQYALPNFFFHLTAAYTILRSREVVIGKEQFDGFHAYPPAMRIT